LNINTKNESIIIKKTNINQTIKISDELTKMLNNKIINGNEPEEYVNMNKYKELQKSYEIVKSDDEKLK